MDLSLKLAKIEEEELLQIWENFTDVLMDDKEDEENQEIREWFEEVIRELATGEEVILSNVNESVKKILGLFISCFNADNKYYNFNFNNCVIAEGNIE